MRLSYIPFTRTLSGSVPRKAVNFLALSGSFPAAFRRFAGGFPAAFLEEVLF